MNVALVVGGSGMLAGACRELSKQYGVVGVVGRTKSKMQSVAGVKNIVPVYVNYADDIALDAALAKFVAEHGRPNLVVAWIHTTSPEAALVVAKYCSGDFYEVTGQSGVQSTHISHRHENEITELGVAYHRVILGRAGERWLTDQEISNGVLSAIDAQKKEFVVGNL